MSNTTETLAGSCCPMCGSPLKRRSGPGRPRRFCTSACKRSAELRVRRVQEHLLRLEREAEDCRRDKTGLWRMPDGTPEQRAQNVAREIASYEAKLRTLLAALEGDTDQKRGE